MSPEQLRALYVGDWKLRCYWTNDVVKLSARPGETLGSYTGTAQISDRDGLLILEITGEAPNGLRWDKQLTMIPTPYRLALDVKKSPRRSNTTEYTRMDLVLSPDLKTLRGVASWNNGLNSNRSNEGQLLRAQMPSTYCPWGVGGSSLTLEREGTPTESPLARPAPSKQPTILLESLDPDTVAEADDLQKVLDDFADLLTAQGFQVERIAGNTPPDFRATLEVARFAPNISGQEAYLDTLSGKPVRFLKGTIPFGAAFTVKDAKGKRTLLSVSLQRARDSATPDENPPTRVTPRGTVLLPADLPLDLRRLLNLLPGQVAALPAKQKRSEHVSRLEELLLKGE